jgi:serine/threonine protein kinase
MMTDPTDRRHRMAVLLEEAFDSGALAFSEPLLEALDSAEPDTVSGRLRSEHGIAYDIEHKLGRGGMATVYLARDPRHDRSIAIKVLHSELTARMGAERFVREIRLTARLQHPHVLGLLDSGVFDRDAGVVAGRLYYVMPYVEGESLRARLTREGALPHDDAMRVLREIADALSYAHEQGVVHRDIKPENILLSRGHAVVADFGIAKAIEAASGDDRPEGARARHTSEENPPVRSTWSSTLIGTPAYMAPEQAGVGAHVDHRADLYAWGVVAYEIMSGRHPFAGRRSAAELLSAHMAAVPRPIRDVAPSVSPALAALVMRCLAKAPTDRPNSAAEVVAALDSVAIDKGAERPSRRAASHRVRSGVMAALGVLAVLVATTEYVGMRPRTVVVQGTGNPATDVDAIQVAVDRADTVVLGGTFSFRRPPTNSLDPIVASANVAVPRQAQVLVSKAVTILGVSDTHGGMATIDGGTIPFYVHAPGARVAIRRLHFVGPIHAAVLVDAARGLDIASNWIDGVKPFGGVGVAIDINTNGGIPKPSDSGRPDRVSGILSIYGNRIDATGGTGGETTIGIMVWSVGQSREDTVAVDINGNNVKNTTASAIMVRRAAGLVRVTANRIETSTEVAREPDHEAVRLVNTGKYRMAGNIIDCRWANGVGIAVFSQFREWPIQGAVIEDNQVNMRPPPSIVFADSSAAIHIKGFADSNVVQGNTISGRARAALALETFKSGYPSYNAIIDNHVDNFHASLASVVVGLGVLQTRLVHPGTVADHGEGTRIEP